MCVLGAPKDDALITRASLDARPFSRFTALVRHELAPTLARGVAFWPAVDFLSYAFVPWVWMPLVSNAATYAWTVLLAVTAPTLPLLPPGPTPRAGAAAVVLGLASYGAVHRVRSGLHTPAQICVGAAIGSADAALWLLWAQPRLQRALSGGQLVALASVFVVIGALTIGSVERWLRRRGGLRAVLKGDSD